MIDRIPSQVVILLEQVIFAQSQQIERLRDEKEKLASKLDCYEKIKNDTPLTNNEKLYNKHIKNVALEENRIRRRLMLDDKLAKKIRDRELIFHIFKEQSLDNVLDAIKNKAQIEEIDISEEIKNPLFRFITPDSQSLSFKVSEVISTIYTETRRLSPEIAELGRQKNKENADEFARNMYDIINSIQQKENVSSYRETVRVLNKKNVPTSKGGQWHTKTLQDLKKRWIELEILPASKPIAKPDGRTMIG